MNPPPDEGFDQRVADWLEQDPDQAPSAVLRTVMAAYPSIPQRRRWRLLWRFPTVNRLVLLGAPIAIVGIAVVVAALGVPRLVSGPGVSGPPGASSSPSAGIATPTPSFAVTPSARLDYSSRPGWILLEHLGANAPDGSGLDEAPDGRSLWLIRPDGTELHELAPGLPVDGKTNPVWSRDGTGIAFESVYPRSLVFQTDVAGHDPVVVGQHDADCLLEGPVPCFERSPAYSPDGDHLATVSSATPDGSAGEVIYLRLSHKIDGGTCNSGYTCGYHLGAGLEATQVDTSVGRIEGLSWSPDGTQIAYYVVAKDADNKPTGSSELWIVDATVPAENPEPHRIPLPEGLTGGDPDWSPDSSLIVFSSQPIHDWNDVGVPDHPDVYTVRPDGSDLQRLTYDLGSGSPTWTSDGKILFYSQREMWLMDADGSNAAPVYPDGPTLWGEDTGWSYYGYWQPIP